MRYNLFNSGRSVQTSLLDGSMLPTEDVEGGIYYAGHLVRRHVVLPFIYDATMPKFVQLAETMNTKPLIDGDSFASHYLYAGTKVQDVVFHVKKASAGITLKAQLRKASDASAIGNPFTVDMSAEGYFRSDMLIQAFLEDDAFLDVKISGGDLSAACFAAFVELTFFNDHHQCACVQPCCDAEFPEPNCMPG